MKVSKTFAAAAAVLSTALVLSACSQSTPADESSSAAAATSAAASAAASEAAPASSAAAAAMPAPFDAPPVKVALVQNSGAGDYFQQWTNGAKQQAATIGMELQVYDAQADNAKQATDMETAIGSGVSAIIVDHGQADTMCPLIVKATDAGIKVTVYDIEITECAPAAVETAQSDADLATLVLTQMATDIGQSVPVGYVNVLGIAPLDRRDVVWQQFVKDNKWEQLFFVGKFTNAVATDNAQLVDAALKANPTVKAIFAPYDELTKGTVSAIEQNNMQKDVSAYGIDISNATSRSYRRQPLEGPPRPTQRHRRRCRAGDGPRDGRTARHQGGRLPGRPRHPAVPRRQQDHQHGRAAGRNARAQPDQRGLCRLDSSGHLLGSSSWGPQAVQAAACGPPLATLASSDRRIGW
jgi:simple sugar transport system substrate-binding protein